MKNTFLLLTILSGVFLNAQNYILDSSFGGTGTVVTNYNMYYDNDQAPKNVFFENNKYIFTQKTQLSSFNYDGTVDYTFGTLGYSRIIVPNCSPYATAIKSAKIINNNIFVFGQAYNPATSLFYGFIAKMGIDGIIDTNFGTNGVVAVNIGTTNNDPYSEGISDIAYINGNYFGMGTVSYNDMNGVFRKNIFVVKLSQSGNIDLTIDPTGIKKIDSIDGHEARNIYEYQGGLLIVGHITNNNTGNENSLTVLKVDDDGNLVSTFGVNGVKKITLSPLGWQTGESFNNCKLIGDDLYFLRTYFIYSNVVQKIQRVNVTDFATTEISSTANNSTFSYVLNSDKIYVIGCLGNCQNDFNVIRRNIDGSLDTTFNQTGTYTYNFPQPNSFTTTYDSATVLVKDNNDRILIGGFTSAQSYTMAPYHGFAMLRIKDETLSTTDVGIGNLILSPNPIHDFLNIEEPNGVSFDNITIFDVLGKTVYSSNNPPNKINLEFITAGLYFVNLKSGQSNYRVKIIKN